LKVKLEPQKTSLRLSKDEFQTLKNQYSLSEQTIFPDGKTLNFHLALDVEQHFSFDGSDMRFILPNQLIFAYKPAKSGLSFKYQCGNGISHMLVLEVDIKKPPLGTAL